MNKIALDYFANSVGVQAVAAIGVALWILRLLGDEKLATGIRRLLKLIDDSTQMPDRGPDWYVRPMAGLWMTANAVLAAHFALFALAATWAMTLRHAAPLKSMLAFALPMCGMALCLRAARSAYECSRRRSAKRTVT